MLEYWLDVVFVILLLQLIYNQFLFLYYDKSVGATV